MSRDRYRYIFTDSVDFQNFIDTLHQAVRAVEALFGEGRVRLDARFSIKRHCKQIAIDASTETGQRLNEVFAYYLAREHGLTNFRVQRIESSRPPAEDKGAA